VRGRIFLLLARIADRTDRAQRDVVIRGIFHNCECAGKKEDEGLSMSRCLDHHRCRTVKGIYIATIIVTSEFAFALAASEHRSIAVPAMRDIETCKDSRYKVQEIIVETRAHCPRAFVAYGAAHYNYPCINALIPPRHDVETPSGW